MSKKILALAISLAMMLTLIPAGSFAYTDGAGNGKDFKASFRATEYDLDYLKQACQGELDDAMWSYTRDDYCDEVWQEIVKCYNEETNRIKNCTRRDEFMEIFWSVFLVYVPGSDYYTMLTLGGYTKDVYSSDKDLSKIMKDGKAETAAGLKNYKSSDYNAYYRSMYDSAVKTYNQAVNALPDKDKSGIENLLAFVDATSQLEGTLSRFFISYEDEDSEYEEFDISLDIFEKLTSCGSLKCYVTHFPFNGIDELDTMRTKEEIDIACFNALLYVENYMKRQLDMVGYDQDRSELQAMYNDLKAQFAQGQKNGSISLTDINYAALNVVDDMVDMNGVDYAVAGQNKKDNVLNEIYTMAGEYIDRNKYSEEALDRIYYLAGDAETILVYANYEAEYYNILPQFEKELKKIPTEAAELKALKAKYTKQLNACKTKAKYDQKKLAPVLKKALAAVKNAKTVEACKSTYKAYMKKINATVKTFKITVVKKGSGTVTKSKVVKYGTSYTVEILPAPGYKIKSVKIDGKSKKLKNSYKFTNIKAAHKIVVTFGK